MFWRIVCFIQGVGQKIKRMHCKFNLNIFWRIVMYVRAITLPIQPSKVENAIGVFKTTIAPMFQQQNGFKGGYLVGDRNTGRTLSVTIWETEADASALDSSGFYEKWTTMLATFLSGTAAREQDEVYLSF
jgi:heme-degrading monooxygenase HmoA